jgi:hypothetical protein
MAKIDLAIISQEGHGQPVPPEMDRHIISRDRVSESQ